jgi:hypothetical protein
MKGIVPFLQENFLFKMVVSHGYHFIGAFALAALAKAVKSYCEGGKCRSKARMDGKTVIITGANTGIGKETALDLAKRGARVIIACRDVKKGICAAEQIRKLSGNSKVVVQYLDLASFDSVRKFARHINETEAQVDVLINNAGESLLFGVSWP